MKNKWIIKAENILINGIIATLKAVFLIRYEYSMSDNEDELIVSEIKNQGIIPQMSQGINGMPPSSVVLIFKPYVKANQITKIDITG
jgi:hypothetical protein